MYINYQFLFSKELTINHLTALQMIFQKEYTLVENFEEELNTLLSIEYIEMLKKSENMFESRVTKKGKTFLDKIGTMGYTEEIGELCKELIELYTGYNKVTGTKLEVQNRLIWFISQTGFNPPIIKNVVQDYLSENTTYTKSLENLIWKPGSVFSTHKNLKDSHLYDVICKKYKLNSEFFLKKKKGVELTWLHKISQLKPPKKSKNKEIYLTGSYESDMLAINKIKSIYIDLAS